MIMLNSKTIIPIQKFKSYLPTHWSYACFHVSSTVSSVQKQSKIMSKMLRHERKRKWYDSTSSIMPSAKALNARDTGKKSLRRVAVLNKLFMKNITDLLSMGGIAYEILGRGLEISKVNISNDFNTVNVYWVCRNEEQHDNSLEAVLHRVAGALRHELSQLRVMGEVPTICFVKDMHEYQIIQLDKRLEKADFGEDYVPKKFNTLKSNFTLETKLSPVEKESIEKLENSSVNMEVEETLPPMTHTVFNLDHQAIMNRLVAACGKSRKAWSGQIDAQIQDDVANRNFQRMAQLPIHEQKQDLTDFLKKRQILIDKMHKDLKKRDSSDLVCDEDYDDENYDDSLLENYEFNVYIEEELNELNETDTIFEK